MKTQVTVEVRIAQQGSYGNAFTLGDTYMIELNTLSEMAQILVKLHEACDEVARQAHIGKPRG